MRLTLPIIVLSQFFCTSLWFAGNSVIADLAKELHLETAVLAHFMSSIQFGVLLLAFLFIWSITVIADFPLFSTLIAQNAPEESRGTSLTIVNCIGFTITIVSIQLINLLSNTINSQFIYVVLAIGPILGLFALKKRNHFSLNL